MSGNRPVIERRNSVTARLLLGLLGSVLLLPGFCGTATLIVIGGSFFDLFTEPFNIPQAYRPYLILWFVLWAWSMALGYLGFRVLRKAVGS